MKRPSNRLVRRLLAVTATLAASASLVAAAGPASAATATWSPQTIPAPSAYTSSLADVSCTSASFCAAVGDDAGLNGTAAGAFAESWDGSKWTVQPTPPVRAGATNAVLAGVSCASPSFCVAVGNDYYTADNHSISNVSTLADLWDGTHWTAMSIPTPAGRESLLTSVSCTSASFCEAVGSANGWASPNNFVDEPFAAVWNGTAWSLQTMPSVGAGTHNLNSVSCTSRSSCVGVGGYFAASNPKPTAFAEIWNGTAWSVQTLPTPAGASDVGLHDVSCSSATSCEGVGSWQDSSNDTYKPLIEFWDGGSWTIQTVPTIGDDARLIGISCSSSSTCEAVGNYRVWAGVAGAFAEVWDGATWNLQSVPAPADMDGTDASVPLGLSATACAPDGPCEAVGYYMKGVNSVPLAEQYVPVPTAPGAPVGATASAGDARAVVSWTAPSNTGGSAISGYQIRYSSDGGVSWTPSSSAMSSPSTVAGLTNGTPYTFEVAAVNGVGTGAWSVPSAAVTPAAPTAPGAPTGVKATAGDASASVSWAVPASNGGSPISGYTVRYSADGGSTWSAPSAVASSPATINGLTNGTAYVFEVAAVNGVGTSAWSSPSSAVTPTAPPQPTPVTASFTSWTVQADAPTSKQLTATGGTGPYTWALLANAQTPHGVSMTSAGVLSANIPANNTSPGHGTFRYRVTDSKGATFVGTVAITWNPGAIYYRNWYGTGHALPGVTHGKAYSAQIVTGRGWGTADTFSVIQGALPAGLRFNGRLGKQYARISGTPTKRGTYSFRVQVKDGHGQTAISYYVITVS